jgi:superfamily II DNA helicase RecQ
MQQSGRAGRDGLQSLSVVYYHPTDMSKTAKDENCKTFCTTQSCRRKFLVQHFTPENTTCVEDVHTCCDICKSSCSCSACPDLHPSCLIIEDKDMVQALAESENRTFRNITHTQRLSIQQKIEELRRKMISDLNINTSIGLLTGLSEKVIEDIVSNVHYIFAIEDILTEYAYDEELAQNLLNIVEDVLGVEEKQTRDVC